MDDEIKETELHVAGISDPGRAEQVRRVILALDGDAQISFEPDHELVRIASRAQVLEVTDALSRAGLDPTAMTG